MPYSLVVKIANSDADGYNISIECPFHKLAGDRGTKPAVEYGRIVIIRVSPA